MRLRRACEGADAPRRGRKRGVKGGKGRNGACPPLPLSPRSGGFIKNSYLHIISVICTIYSRHALRFKAAAYNSYYVTIRNFFNNVRPLSPRSGGFSSAPRRVSVVCPTSPKGGRFWGEEGKCRRTMFDRSPLRRKRRLKSLGWWSGLCKGLYR